MSSDIRLCNGFWNGMRNMKVNVHDQTGQRNGRLRRLLKRLFKKVSDTSSFEIIFVDDEEIRRLNRTYRTIDRVTDVLSFPNDDASPGDASVTRDAKASDDHIHCETSLGDVFIDLEQARRQAESLGHGFEREVGFLAVHGYLHLKGYDHLREEDEIIMIQEQERILKKAKLERMTK